MGLPNYSPTGTILFGSVPWNNTYSNVRLYNDLTEQYNDISTRMTERSSNYSYIGRDRRLKVSIEADKLYHCNYCMYRNESLTDGFIYCFVSNVTYINDHTSEITLETDVFQTYLHGVDWRIPACFISRETVPTESEKYLLTNEPDFPLIYQATTVQDQWFDYGGIVIMTCAEPERSNDIVDAIFNPNGMHAVPAPSTVYKGVGHGASFYFCPIDSSSGHSESMELFLNEITNAGSVESIVAIFTIPSFAARGLQQGFFPASGSMPDNHTDSITKFKVPGRGATLGDYTPRNRKLLYYPYTFCRLTDYNGSQSDLRYELLGADGEITVKYAISPTCQALVYPTEYMGNIGVESGITAACGAQGSWSNNAFETWLAQNSGQLALSIANLVVSGAVGAASLTAAGKALGLGAKAIGVTTGGIAAGLKSAKTSMAIAGAAGLSAASTASNLYPTLSNAMHQPTVTRGQCNYNTMFQTGVQGVHAVRIALKEEVAEQIDEFFDRWGYAVERIEAVNITSRQSWNYVKTEGCSPRSLNFGADSTAPFSRGRGTPAEALSIIQAAFDGGITFWHTTDGFGDYSLPNTI